MKNILRLLFAAFVLSLSFAACNKVDDLPLYGTGNAVALSSTASTIAAAPADSSNTVVTFSWSNPNYAQDSSLYKFVVEIDSTGRNFTKAFSKTVRGTFSTSMTAKELNTVLLGFGFAFNTQYDIDVRVTSSYGNNNDAYKSNTLKLKVTPYKIPPKIVPPSSLFIVGSATAGSWNNPVPVPTQQLARVDETTFMGVFDMSGNNQYLLLPVNGDWGNKYSVSNGSLPGLNEGGDFGFNLPDNFPGPNNPGTYLLVVDFQIGKFSLTPYTGPQMPTDLFIVGDATPGGWNNPVPVPSQQFTRLNAVQFEITIPITPNKEYLCLPVNGSWSNKYSVPNKTLPGLSSGGYFGYNFGDNFPGPAVQGDYKIELNFALHDPAAPNAPTAWFKTTKL